MNTVHRSVARLLDWISFFSFFFTMRLWGLVFCCRAVLEIVIIESIESLLAPR